MYGVRLGCRQFAGMPLGHFLGCVLHRPDDVVISGTPTEVPGQTVPDILFSRIRVLLKQVHRRHNHAGSAEAALEAVHFPEALLDWVKLSVRGQALDCGDLSPVCLDCEDRARLDCGAVQYDSARTTAGCVAADMCAGQVQCVSQVLDE